MRSGATRAESRDESLRAWIPARKQLAYLGQFLLGVFLTALFFQLRISDSRTHREDFESIAALGSLIELPVHGVLADANKPDSGPQFAGQFDRAVQRDVHSWLTRNHPDLDESHRKARDLTTEWLQQVGLTADEAKTLSGKGHGDRVPFLFFRSGVVPLKSRFGNEAEVKKNPPIGFLLDQVRYLGSPVTLTVVQKVNRPDFPQLDFKVTHDYRTGYRLVSVELDDRKRLVATFEKNQLQQQQQKPEQTQRFIPVVTQEISSPSILEIISSGLHADRLGEIATDQARDQHLYTLYAGLRLDNARTMTGNRMLDSFQDVEILGFKFSPRYFWIFTFAFLAAALIAIVVHLRRQRLDDEPTAFGLDILIDAIAFRILLWCVIPPTAMLMAKPQETSAFILAAYWVAFASLIVTGAWLVWFSVRGIRQDRRLVSESSQSAPAADQAAPPTAAEPWKVTGG
jgi:hypothetical protein